MGKLGGGIMLIVVGAILSFAVQVSIPGVGRYTLGIILMLGGLLVIGLHFMMDNQRRHSTTFVDERTAVVDDRDALLEDPAPVVRTRRRRRFLG
jgi:uncharacterized membrane protein